MFFWSLDFVQNKMIFKFTLLVVLCVVYASSQSSESDSRCNPQPIINCNSGPSGPQSDVMGSDDQTNIKQGKPGKIGPKGSVGRKGQKGERGRPDDTAEELIGLKRQIDELKNDTSTDEKLIELKSQVEDQKRQIDELINLTPLTSCDEVALMSNRTSGFYTISPERNYIRFRIHCIFLANGTETIIYHNTSSEVQVANCEDPRCSKHKIAYDVTLPHIIALINQSAECRQFIKYRCIASQLFQNGNPAYATWLSRDGTPQIYWGGATSRRDHYCACGETNSCVDTNYNCNCDKNNGPETSDEGYLTDKDKLPVTELQVGDATAPGEFGWFTLGPLICSGRSA